MAGSGTAHFAAISTSDQPPDFISLVVSETHVNALQNAIDSLAKSQEATGIVENKSVDEVKNNQADLPRHGSVRSLSKPVILRVKSDASITSDSKAKKLKGSDSVKSITKKAKSSGSYSNLGYTPNASKKNISEVTTSAKVTNNAEQVGKAKADFHASTKSIASSSVVGAKSTKSGATGGSNASISSKSLKQSASKASVNKIEKSGSKSSINALPKIGSPVLQSKPNHSSSRSMALEMNQKSASKSSLTGSKLQPSVSQSSLNGKNGALKSGKAKTASKSFSQENLAKSSLDSLGKSLASDKPPSNNALPILPAGSEIVTVEYQQAPSLE